MSAPSSTVALPPASSLYNAPPPSASLSTSRFPTPSIAEPKQFASHKAKETRADLAPHAPHYRHNHPKHPNAKAKEQSTAKPPQCNAKLACRLVDRHRGPNPNRDSQVPIPSSTRPCTCACVLSQSSIRHAPCPPQNKEGAHEKRPPTQ